MHPVVRANWKKVNEPLEGAAIPYMYLDIKGLVTVGTGNLLENPSGKTNFPPERCLVLPWYLGDRPATRQEIIQDWQKVNNTPSLAKMHHKYAAAHSRIRLRPEGLDTLLYYQLAEDYAFLKKNHFPELDSYCADAQLAILSLAWACGANWPAKFPKTKKAILARDWTFAAAEGVINSTGNPGVIPRNAINRRCFLNAYRVEKYELDPSVLYWPNEAAASCPTCGRPV